MYQNPVLLPQQSNREDFILTVAICDDDSAGPGQSPTTINIDGTSRAAPGPFTSAAWTVVDGQITTTSATSITIPDYPIGSQLSALALTVGVGLNIQPGDFVVISDTGTGLNTMTGYVQSYGANSGALVVQIGFTFQFEIRRGPPHNNSDYLSFYDWGGIGDDSPILSVSLGAGITHIGVGVIQIFITEATFKTISNGMRRQPGVGTFNVGLTMTDTQNTRQLFIGTLPVFFGNVSN
jgi:hypothetical protein